MAFKGIKLFESFEDEQARLAEAPEGSAARFWSTLPERITGWPRGVVVELPDQHGENSVVVVPVEYSPSHREQKRRELPVEDREGGPLRRPDGSWKCIVVASDDPRCPLGGHDLLIPHVEIIRGVPLSEGQLLDAVVVGAALNGGAGNVVQSSRYA